MPEDKEKMISVIDDFFDLDDEQRVLYQVGRRMGFFKGPDEIRNSPHLERVKQACDLYGVTAANVDEVIDELMKRFV